MNTSPSIVENLGLNVSGLTRNNISQAMTIVYKPLDDIFGKSVQYAAIPLPSYVRSKIVEENGLRFNAKNGAEHTEFKVTAYPYNDDKGKKGVKDAFAELHKVRSPGYEPAVASLVYQDKEGKNTQEITISDCIIVNTELVVRGDNPNIVINFTLKGIITSFKFIY